MASGDMYCSSSFAGNTRRYHGLLIHKGTVILSGLHDEANGIRLSSGWWGDTFLGDGLSWSIGATVYPVRQEFAIPGAFVIRTFLLGDVLTIRYEITGTVSLRIRPLMTRRSVKELTWNPVVVSSETDGKPILNGYRVTGNLMYTPDETWYQNAFYPGEQEQGYEARENLLSPGFFSGVVTDGVVEIQFMPPGYQPAGRDQDAEKPVDLLVHASRLFWTGDQIRAGYPRFTESRGRDTFISLPGLLLEADRFREAEEIFRRYLANRQQGIIINQYPDSCHSADTTLWFFWALFQYIQKLPGSPFISTIRHEIQEILLHYPRSGIVSLSGSLLSVDSRSTGMSTPYTPRNGKAVEINALWILMLEMAEFLKLTPPVRSQDARREFQAFWNEKSGCLYDRLEPEDPSVRSNQVIALGLGLVSFDEGRRALEVIRKDLLTPYGLRTLAPGSPGYCGRYAGDASFHNGMVWPWQTGFYVDALLEYGEEPATVRSSIQPLWNFFLTDGAGMLPECFDGDAPHQPGGAICFASSIGEMIRARNRIRQYMTISE